LRAESCITDFSPLYAGIDELLARKERVVAAIDGGCAAGKTTLAAMLKSRYGCNVFATDDFFLTPGQRTAARFAEPGGNVDYERFAAEIIGPLKRGEPVVYRPFDCGAQDFAGGITVGPNRLNVVEGVYSMHPYFGDVYDIRVFMEIGGEEQRKRLIRRNKELYGRFVAEWIPLEARYFEACRVRERCDFVFKASKQP